MGACSCRMSTQEREGSGCCTGRAGSQRAHTRITSPAPTLCCSPCSGRGLTPTGSAQCPLYRATSSRSHGTRSAGSGGPSGSLGGKGGGGCAPTVSPVLVPTTSQQPRRLPAQPCWTEPAPAWPSYTRRHPACWPAGGTHDLALVLPLRRWPICPPAHLRSLPPQDQSAGARREVAERDRAAAGGAHRPAVACGGLHAAGAGRGVAA